MAQRVGIVPYSLVSGDIYLLLQGDSIEGKQGPTFQLCDVGSLLRASEDIERACENFARASAAVYRPPKSQPGPSLEEGVQASAQFLASKVKKGSEGGVHCITGTYEDGSVLSLHLLPLRYVDPQQFCDASTQPIVHLMWVSLDALLEECKSCKQDTPISEQRIKVVTADKKERLRISPSLVTLFSTSTARDVCGALQVQLERLRQAIEAKKAATQDPDNPIDPSTREVGIRMVCPGVFLSDTRGANHSQDLLRDLGVTHILTIGHTFSEVVISTDPRSKRARFVHFQLAASTMAESGLTSVLGHVTQAVDIMIEAVQEESGAILVHDDTCILAPFFVAAYMIKVLNKSEAQAVKAVMTSFPAARINEGFTAQLRRYKALQCTIPTDEQVLIDVSEKEGAPRRPQAAALLPTWDSDDDNDDNDNDDDDDDQLKDDSTPCAPSDDQAPSTSTAPAHSGEATITPPAPAPSPEVDHPTAALATTASTATARPPAKDRYRCKKCRSLLFLDIDIIDHQPGPGQGSFAWKKRDLRPGFKSSCGAVFLDHEHVSWIRNTGENEGKLKCPKCASLIGSYMWSGNTCSCGAWMTPAMQVTLSRVDKEPIRVAAGLVASGIRIRQPRVLQPRTPGAPK